MESLKRVHQSVRDTLYEWGYAPMDIVHAVDIGYALYCVIDRIAYIKPHIICLCLDKSIVDMGDGLYMIEEERTND